MSSPVHNGKLGDKFTAALGWDRDSFERMKKRVRDLVDKHLDDRRSAVKQDKDAWEAFLTNIFAEYPELRREEALLKEYVARFLGGRVQMHRVKAWRSACNNRVPTKPMRSHHKTHRAGSVRTQDCTTDGEQISQEPSSPMSDLPPYEAIDAPMPDGVVAVERFLSDARLPHLLRVFCNAGVDNRVKLEAVASWHSSDRFDFLYDLRREGWITRFEAKMLELAFRNM